MTVTKKKAPARKPATKIVPIKGGETEIEGATVAQQIERMAAIGLSTRQISNIFDITPKDLWDKYRDSFETGKAKALYTIGNAVFQTAKDRKHPQHVRAAAFFLRAQGGWDDGVGSGSRNSSNSQEPFAVEETVSDEAVEDRFDGLMKKLRKV